MLLSTGDKFKHSGEKGTIDFLHLFIYIASSYSDLESSPVIPRRGFLSMCKKTIQSCHGPIKNRRKNDKNIEFELS